MAFNRASRCATDGPRAAQLIAVCVWTCVCPRSVANLPAALGEMETDALRDLFVALEASATTPQRNLIVTHPMRPEGIDERVEEAVSKRAEEAEKVKARREEERKEKERQKFEELKRKFEPDAATNAIADEDTPEG